jgi:hypothetical protein
MLELGSSCELLPFLMDTLLSVFDKAFQTLDLRNRELIAKIPDDQLFQKPRVIDNSMAMFSCGEYVLRSAAMVEMTFDGITRRLWDDPFEWTLPERLAEKSLILEYMDEVAATRKSGFAFFISDDDLKREMPAPITVRPIFEILLETLAKAEHFQGRAFAVFQMLSDQKLPRR